MRRKEWCLWYLGFPDSSADKESACNAGDPSLIPGSGSSPGERIGYPLQYSWASLLAQTVRNPPAMRDTWVWFLGWEDPLKEGMATSNILAWRTPRAEEPGGLQSMRSQRVGLNWGTKHSIALFLSLYNLSDINIYFHFKRNGYRRSAHCPFG